VPGRNKPGNLFIPLLRDYFLILPMFTRKQRIIAHTPHKESQNQKPCFGFKAVLASLRLCGFA
jgi:hypothetical protein